MYRFLFTSILCVPLVACGEAKKSCDSKNVLDALHEKLVMGMNFNIGVDHYYDGEKAKITLENPRRIGPSGDYMRCTITMKLTHYVDPKTGVRYPHPAEKSVPMPYSYKNIDAMITEVKVAQ